ncbi:MAG: hypothetical protein ACI9MS_003028, partial [Glaciecola sp.]
MHELIDWARIETMLKDIHINPRGEQAWPLLIKLCAIHWQAGKKHTGTFLSAWPKHNIASRQTQIYWVRHP